VHPLPVPVATTTPDRLAAMADPSGPIWTLAIGGTPVRLIDVVPA
jgi:hypothetical protein